MKPYHICIKPYHICIIMLLCTCNLLFAAQIPSGQDAGSTLKDYTTTKQRAETIKKLSEKRFVPPSLDEAEIKALPVNVDSIYVGNIVIQLDRYAEEHVKKGGLFNLIKEYKNRNLSLEEMKSLASAITQKYADKNIKTYIPKQNFARNVLYINLVSDKN